MAGSIRVKTRKQLAIQGKKRKKLSLEGEEGGIPQKQSGTTTARVRGDPHLSQNRTTRKIAFITAKRITLRTGNKCARGARVRIFETQRGKGGPLAQKDPRTVTGSECT